VYPHHHTTQGQLSSQGSKAGKLLRTQDKLSCKAASEGKPRSIFFAVLCLSTPPPPRGGLCALGRQIVPIRAVELWTGALAVGQHLTNARERTLSPLPLHFHPFGVVADLLTYSIQEELHGLNGVVLLLVLQSAVECVQPAWQYPFLDL